MRTKKLSGLDQELYCIIGKYAMDSSVLKLLDNPITTSFKHTWYLIYDELDSLYGFCSVQNQNYKARLSNLVSLKNDNNSLIETILPVIISDLKGSGFVELSSYCRTEEVFIYEKQGFELQKSRVKWATVSKQIK